MNINHTTRGPVSIMSDPRLMALVVEGIHELYQKGLGSTGYPGLSADNQVLYVEDGTLVIAVLTYSLTEQNQCCWVYMSYVLPDWRREGLFKLLWERLTGLMREQKVGRIEAGTHVDNLTMREIWAKLGRKETHVISSYKVNP